MKAKNRVLFRCVALLLCVVMVAALLPEMTVSAALDTPVVSAKKSGNGIQVSWKPVTGAQKYRVFRKGPSDANWKRLADVASTTVSYKDTNVANGKTYKYTVRCLSKDGKTYQSSYDPAGASVAYWTYNTPDFSLSVVSNGIKISWTSVGAPLYRVFRYNSGWQKVGDTSGTSFVDVSVSPGNTYTYTVRALSADKKAYVSAYNASGKYITFALEFKITALNPVDGGIEITWNVIPGVTKYTIHRWTGQDWHQIHSGYEAGPTYTDLGQDITDHIGLFNNETYTYRVSYTVNSTTKVTPNASQHYNETPELTEVDCNQGKFIVKWKAVQGAAKYRVFRTLDTPPTNNWHQVADVTGNSYTDSDVAAGVNYYYTVRCLGADGKYTSGYDKNGMQADYVGMPTLISTSVENDGVHFKFNKVGGIDEYQIYRKTASTSWMEYDVYTYSTDGGKNDVCDYNDPNVNSGQIYYYTAACRKGGNVVSDKDENGLSVIPRSAPVPKATGAIEVTENGFKINWYGIDGVTRYRIFRREGSGTVWKALGDVSGSSAGVTFTDTTVANKGEYVYTVRCLAPNGNYASGFRDYPAAPIATFYKTPELVSAVTVSKLTAGDPGSIKVTWKPVEGVKYYSVYRRHIRKDGTMSNWVNLTHTATGTFYEDTPPASNFTYIYTVRCSYGAGPMSWYNPNGVRTHFLMAPDAGTNPYTAVKGAITVRWKAVDGATGYKVYRKVPGGNYSCIATVNGYTTLTYKDTYKLVSGQEYYYTVRAFNASSTSGYQDEMIHAWAA